MNEEIAIREKKIAATASLQWVKDGMTVGLGTGSTASHMVDALGIMVKQGLKIVGVPSSDATEALAKTLGIPLTTLEDVKQLDLTIDGADEFDANFQLIKGGGGALLREKILAHNSKLNVIITDSSKQVTRLGKFKLPLETIPFATNSIISELDRLQLKPILRQNQGKVFTTDEGNYIVDINVFDVDDLAALSSRLINIPGIVETGLFLSTTDVILVGKADKVNILKK
ncbi:MAG: ribose-5-phosphate isomerase RpiA [Bacteroidota bacterium]